MRGERKEGIEERGMVAGGWERGDGRGEMWERGDERWKMEVGIWKVGNERLERNFHECA